jgi:hypothetical protein
VVQIGEAAIDQGAHEVECQRRAFVAAQQLLILLMLIRISGFSIALAKPGQ